MACMICRQSATEIAVIVRLSFDSGTYHQHHSGIISKNPIEAIFIVQFNEVRLPFLTV